MFKVDFTEELGLKGRGKTRANPKLNEEDQSLNLYMQINDIKSARILEYLKLVVVLFFFSLG